MPRTAATGVFTRVSNSFSDEPVDGQPINPTHAEALFDDYDAGLAIVARVSSQTSHTGDTNETTLKTFTVPANTIGINGHLRITILVGGSGTNDTKTIRMKFGGTTFMTAVSVSANISGRFVIDIYNRGAANSQVGAVVSNGFSSTAIVTAAIDTTLAKDIVITGQLANGSDAVSVEAYTVEINPAS